MLRKRIEAWDKRVCAVGRDGFHRRGNSLQTDRDSKTVDRLVEGFRRTCIVFLTIGHDHGHVALHAISCMVAWNSRIAGLVIYCITETAVHT